MGKQAKQRIIALCLSIALLIGMVPMNAFAIDDLSGESDIPIVESNDIWDGSVASGFARGTGTESDPYIIETAEQLAYLASSVNSGNDYWDEYIKLENDIVLNDTSNWEQWGTVNGDESIIAPANTWEPIGNLSSAFQGGFDGDGHKISGIYINTDNDYQGLFGYAMSVVENLGIEKSYIKGKSYVGSVFGCNEYGAAIKCYNSGFIINTDDYVGGIVGVATGCRLNDCYNNGTVSGNDRVGGVVGSGGTVSFCYNTGSVSGNQLVGGVSGNASQVNDSYNIGNINGNKCVGGVAGEIGYGKAEYCYNTGKVIGNENNVGGVFGYVDESTVTGCYNTADVIKPSSSSKDSCCVGGVVGYAAYKSTVTACYNTGNVTGISTSYGASYCYVGGIVGNGYGDVTVISCYNIGTIDGEGSKGSYVGGVIGTGCTATYCYYLDCCVMDGTDYGVALTDSQMRQQSSFENWNFNGIWEIGFDIQYPYPTLRYFGSKTYCYRMTFEDEGKVICQKDVLSGVNITCEAPYEKDKYEFLYYKRDDGVKYYPSDLIVSERDAVYNAVWAVKNTLSNIWNGDVDTEWQGSGTETEPYIISTAEELAGLAQRVKWYENFENTYFVLTNDIILGFDSSEYSEYISAKYSWIPIGGEYYPFNGIFDGNGHTVSGIYINNADNHQGLFGNISNATVKNLGIIDSYIKGKRVVGAVVGGADEQSKIINCYNSATVMADDGYAGGVVGNAYEADIISCYNTGTVIGVNDGGIGGVAGCNNRIVKDCFNSGNVYASKSEKNLCNCYAGGVVGCAWSDVEGCYNIGIVSSNDMTAGGVVGDARQSVVDCYNKGIVYCESEYDSAGGVIGEKSEDGTVKNCYNTGKVSADKVGGVIGDDRGSLITDCYNTSNRLTGNYIGGIVYYTYGNTQIENCKNSGNINGSNSSGGIANSNHGLISNCENSGDIIAGSAGGISATNSGIITESNNSGDIYAPNAGGISGSNSGEGAVISGCYNAGDISFVENNDTGSTVCLGGISAGNYSASIYNCHNIGSIDVNGGNTAYVGGITAKSDYNKVKCELYDCTNTGEIVITNVSSVRAGGIIGQKSAEIHNCRNNGDIYVDIQSGSYQYIGGVIGENYGPVNSCYNTGDVVFDITVSSNNCGVGGVVGYGFSGEISDCFNVGSVSGQSDIGGVVGYSYNSKINTCYNIGEVYGLSYVGGIVGIFGNTGSLNQCYYLDLYNMKPGTELYEDDGQEDDGEHYDNSIVNLNSYGTSLTEEEMKQQESFTGFDFENVWEIGKYEYYPYPTLINCPYGDKSFKLFLLDENGVEIESGFTVDWYDLSIGKKIGTGNIFSYVDENKQYCYEISLGDELCKVYYKPDNGTVSWSENNNKFAVALKKLSTVKVSGSVADENGTPMSGVQVTFKQTYSNKCLDSITTVSDANGKYQAEIKDVYTKILFEAEGYYNNAVALISEPVGNSEIQVNDVSLLKLPKNIITLSLLELSAEEDGKASYLTERGNTNGLSFALYNQTKSKEISDFVVQGLNIYLGDNTIEPYDEIIISVTDERKQVTADKTSIIVDGSMLGNAEIVLTENGSLKINQITGSEQTDVIVFDKYGKNVSSSVVSDYYEGEPLLSGIYTLVLINKTELFRNPENISVFEELGLKDNTDYVKSGFEIQNGKITVIDTMTVPILDESKFYYTVKDKTGMYTNVTEISAGKYITVKAEYQIDSKYSSNEETVSIVFPDGVNPVTGSLSLNGIVTPYSFENNVLTVRTDRNRGTIRFYAIALESGKYCLNAYLSFDSEFGLVKQPIGNAVFDVTSTKINVPKKAGRKDVTVTGTTVANATVTVFDNGVSVGTAKANKNGNWSLMFSLVKPYNYSYHDIYAEIESDLFYGKIITDTSVLCYDENYIEVSKVTMYNTGDNGQNISVFDFINPNTAVPSYRFWPGRYPVFTFKVEFTGGDDTVISDVYVVTTNAYGEETYVPCTYDKESGLWIGTHNYNSTNEAPANVNVVYEIIGNKEHKIPDDIGERISNDLEKYNDAFIQLGFDFSDYIYVSIVETTDNSAKISVNLKGGDEHLFDLETEKTGEIIPLSELEDYKHQKVDEGYKDVGKSDGKDISQKSGGDGTDTIKYNNPDEDGNVIIEEEKIKIDFDFGLFPDDYVHYPEPDQISNLAGYLLDLASLLPGRFGSFSGFAGGLWGLAGQVSLGYEVARMEREVFDDYNLFIELSDYSYKYLLKKCEDGTNALTDAQIYQFRDRLNFLRDSYDKEKTEMITKIFRFNIYAATISGLHNIIGSFDGIGILDSLFVSSASLASGGTITNAGIEVWHQIVDLFNENIMMLQSLQDDIFASYKCKVEPDKKQPANNSINQPAKMIIDPSGYVYEAVPSNRVEGVKAEIYYYDYELDDFGVPSEEKTDILWDAENYDQLNPLYTDVNGEYQWDVPFGQWLVKFSKDGYYDTDSRKVDGVDADGYLPVPPPQTEVNVGIVSQKAPTVKEISVYENEVRIVFSQYVQPDTVNANSVVVKMNGKIIEGVISPVNAEYDYEHINQYATTFIFTPAVSLSGNVSINISNVKNYAGTVMTSPVNKSNYVEIKPESIITTDSISVTYNSGTLLEISVLPSEIGAGHILSVTSSSPSIVGIANATVATDENGCANIMLLGNLPGSAEITVSLQGTDLCKIVTVNVSGVVSVSNQCEKVKANIVSGSQVESGTLLVLSTDTEGAEIYYTLDGTCPCVVDSSSRQKYITPIEITGDMFIIAYAVKEGMQDSYTSGFTFSVMSDKQLQLIEDSNYALSDAFISNVKKNTTADAMRSQFTNENTVINNLSGNAIGDNDVVGSGFVICIINGDEIIDQRTIIVEGDVNCDGEVDAKDATQITRYSNGKTSVFGSTSNTVLEEARLRAGNVNGDNEVDAKDATQITRYSNGKTSIFDTK